MAAVEREILPADEEQPIDRILLPIQAYMRIEASGGILLLLTFAGLVIVLLPIGKRLPEEAGD